MQWSDHLNETGFPTPSELDILMNHDGPHNLCPTGSIRDVYLEKSYGALSLESTVVAWVPMDNTQAYYANGLEGYVTIAAKNNYFSSYKFLPALVFFPLVYIFLLQIDHLDTCCHPVCAELP